MYAVYSLEVYDHIQQRWVPSASHEASNRPHHYDHLREGFDRLVKAAKSGSLAQAPIGYRILQDGYVVDSWTNGKVNDAH